ncbi:hypothetical protein Tco_0309357 [Tanacetum coccineum]
MSTLTFIRYALTVNPTIYTSCIKQFWSTAKAKTVNGERQIQSIIDKNKVLITKTSIRSDLHLKDAGGTDCLPTATIFKELARIGYEKPSQKLTFYKAFFSPQWKFLIHTITQFLSVRSTAWNEFSGTMASLIISLDTNQKFNLSKYIFDDTVKHLDGGVKFLMYLRFLQVFINQQLGDMSHYKKIYVNPSHTNKIFSNMKREGNDFSGRITPLFETMMVQANKKDGVDLGIPTDSQQTPITTQPSSSRSQKKQSKRKQRKNIIVLDLEKEKDAQAKEIVGLKKRVQKLEKKKKSRTTGFKRLRKVDKFRRVEFSKDKDSLGDHEDASKQGRSIKDIDKDAVAMDMPVGEKQEQSTKEREINTSVEDNAALTTIEEITLAQTLIQIKAAKPKVVTTAATTTTTTRPKARGVVVQEPSEFRTPQESQPSMIKDKGKAIMIEPEVPLKRKDQVALDEDLARNLQAQLEAELIEEERLARKKEEEANIALIESWDNTQAMMEADFELAQRLQTEEQREITIEERSRLSEEKAKGSRKKMLNKKRAGKEQQQESSKRQRMDDVKEIDEHEEVEEVDEAELKKHLEIIKVLNKLSLQRSYGFHNWYQSFALRNFDLEDILRDLLENGPKQSIDNPLTPRTITNILNKKLQTDYWNEKCYQTTQAYGKAAKGSIKEDIECKDSYDSNLDESTFLVTPLSDSNEDKCFTPSDDVKFLLYRDPSTPMISVVSILEGFTDEPPLEDNNDLFDLKSKTNEWKKILYDDSNDDLIFDPGGDVDEIDAFLDIDIPTNIKDGFYNSEGDVLYLESLLSDDTTPSPPPEVFLDRDPRSLRDINNLKIMVKVFDPGIHETSFSPTYVSLPFEDRHYLSFTYVIRIFLPYFTYPMDYFLPLSSENEDIIFDPGISAFHFSSLKPVAYECPMEVCSSTCFVPSITLI